MWPVNSLIVKPVVTFQILISPSPEPLANESSGSTARDLTELVCPFNVLIVSPLVIFQIIIVLSLEPLANKPSESNARE